MLLLCDVLSICPCTQKNKRAERWANLSRPRQRVAVFKRRPRNGHAQATPSMCPSHSCRDGLTTPLFCESTDARYLQKKFGPFRGTQACTRGYKRIPSISRCVEPLRKNTRRTTASRVGHKPEFAIKSSGTDRSHAQRVAQRAEQGNMRNANPVLLEYFQLVLSIQSESKRWVNAHDQRMYHTVNDRR